MKTTKTAKNFTPLHTITTKKLKNKQFRKSFLEEINRLRLAHEIKKLRQKRKMTQTEVAVKVNMPQSVIARIESGNHSLSVATLNKIAMVFNKQIGLVKQTQNRQ